MLIELYHIDRKNCKWYMRIVWWVLGVAVVNSWLLAKQHSNKISLMDFHSDVAYGLLMAKKPSSGCSSGKKRGRPPVNNPRPEEGGSKVRRMLPIADVRYDKVDHWPEYKKENKCALCKIKKTSVFCTKCKINLCMIVFTSITINKN